VWGRVIRLTVECNTWGGVLIAVDELVCDDAYYLGEGIGFGAAVFDVG
jgi:hypothetical protein